MHVLNAFPFSEFNKRDENFWEQLHTFSARNMAVQAKSKLSGELRNAQEELDKLRDQLEEEELSRSDAQRLVQKANSEMSALQQRLEGNMAGAAQQELDDVKRKMNARIQEVTAQMEAATGKAANADKARKRLQSETEELTAELDKVITISDHTAREFKTTEVAQPQRKQGFSYEISF